MFRILLLIACINILVFSQSLTDIAKIAEPGFSTNARAMGMGNAFTGLSDDASAMFFNPAGLGLIKKLEITGGLDYLKYNNETSFIDKTTSSKTSKTALNQAAFVFPFPTVQGSLVFGMSYNRMKPLNTTFKFGAQNNTSYSMIQALNDSQLQDEYYIPYDLALADKNGNTNINGHLFQEGYRLSSGSLDNWSFAGAVEVDKNLFIGANISIISGSYLEDMDYTESDKLSYYSNIQADPTEPQSKGFRYFNLKNKLEWEVSGWDAKIGLLYQLKRYGRFGVTFQLPKTYTIKETQTINGSSYFSSSGLWELKPEDYSSKREYDITTPFVLTLGASGNYNGLTLSGDLSYIDYSQAEFSADNVDYSDVNRNVKDNMREVVNWNLGAEYTVPEVDMRVRAGYFVQNSPYVNDEIDCTKHYMTFGLGFLIGKTTILDFAFSHGWWKDYGSNYYSSPSIYNYYDISHNNFAMSIHYRF